jgi:hypothetical protein
MSITVALFHGTQMDAKSHDPMSNQVPVAVSYQAISFFGFELWVADERSLAF